MSGAGGVGKGWYVAIFVTVRQSVTDLSWTGLDLDWDLSI